MHFKAAIDKEIENEGNNGKSVKESNIVLIHNRYKSQTTAFFNLNATNLNVGSVTSTTKGARRGTDQASRFVQATD